MATASNDRALCSL